MSDSATLVSPPLTSLPSNTVNSLTDSSQDSQITIKSGEAAAAAAVPTTRTRPLLGVRQDSGTMIVPHDHPEIELKHETYGPNDARSFSPRRGMEDTEKMVGGKRSLLKSHADELQNGLNAIVEKVESVKMDHDKLERNNSALQDYIGGLTQSMSRTNLATGGRSGSGGRKK